MRPLPLLFQSPYYTALVAAIAVAAALAWRAARRDRVDPIAWASVLAGAAAGGLLGSKFLFFDLQPAVSGEKTILGGILLGVLVVMALAWLLGLGAARTLDRLTAPTLGAMAIGRVGCFFAECCLGVHSAWLGHRHPTVLYEATLDLALMLLLTRAPLSRPGHRIGVGVTGYAGLRFATEFLRDRPEFSAAINPVQWLMLVTVLGIGTWTAMLARADDRRAGHATPRRHGYASLPPTVVAVLLGALTIGIALTMTPWVVPAEQVVLLAIGATVLVMPLRAALRRLLRAPASQLLPRAAMASAPAIGFFLMLQQAEPATPPRSNKYTLGVRRWSSFYDKVAGQAPSYFVPAGCDPGGCDGSSGTCWGDHWRPGADIDASRSTEITAVTGSVQLPVKAPNELVLDGMLFVGRDVSTVPTGAESLSGIETVPVRGGAIALSTGEPNFLFRFGVIGGQLSKNGVQRSTMTPSVLVRISGASGVFVEGSMVDSDYLATHGEFSYAGVGYRHAATQMRVMWGSGAGQILSANVPLGRQWLVELTKRDPDAPEGVPAVAPSWQIGARYRFGRGPRD